MECHCCIDKTGMSNTTAHCANEYTVCVKNYIVYGLRDQYIRLFKKLKVIGYKMVGLKILEHFVEQRSSNFSFELLSIDMTYLKIQENNTGVNEKNDMEKGSCPK